MHHAVVPELELVGILDTQEMGRRELVGDLWEKGKKDLKSCFKPF